MEWISIKDKLPDDGQIVIIKTNYTNPFICVARYLEDLETLEKYYKNIFIMIVHPRFPKEWLFHDKYRKISRIPKRIIDSWMPLPKPPKE
jgi:hypothetical protein